MTVEEEDEEDDGNEEDDEREGSESTTGFETLMDLFNQFIIFIR